jgi:hypothetical protein
MMIRGCPRPANASLTVAGDHRGPAPNQVFAGVHGKSIHLPVAKGTVVLRQIVFMISSRPYSGSDVIVHIWLFP